MYDICGQILKPIYQLIQLISLSRKDDALSVKSAVTF